MDKWKGRTTAMGKETPGGRQAGKMCRTMIPHLAPFNEFEAPEQSDCRALRKQCSEVK